MAQPSPESINIVLGLTGAFLTATGLFFAALGAAGTYNEPLKTYLSLSAFLMTVIWLWSGLLISQSTLLSFDYKNICYVLAIVLPALFAVGWLLSSLVHIFRWLFGIKGVDRHQ